MLLSRRPSRRARSVLVVCVRRPRPSFRACAVCVWRFIVLPRPRTSTRRVFLRAARPIARPGPGERARAARGPAAPPPAHWQGETMLSSAVVFAELVVEAGMDAGQRHGLSARTRLGRSADNDVVLRDPQASRHHAVVTLSGAEYVLTDLGSANGTVVNGVRVGQPCALHHGDLISIGAEQLRFQQR